MTHLYTLLDRAMLVQWLLAMHSRALHEKRQDQARKVAQVICAINRVPSRYR